MSKRSDDPTIKPSKSDDPTAKSRKRDHIELAFQSQITTQELDQRFYYEPILAAHPKKGSLPVIQFLEKSMRVPLWVSSMTGGTEKAKRINHNLARACEEFGMGMGLGSCRSLLRSDERLEDFDVRHLIGEAQPFFANLGIAQLEELIHNKELHLIDQLIERLQADGLIIHVNPLQEWLQPEGDRFRQPPLDTIREVLVHSSWPIIVKEVGQGMGYESLKALLQLPLAAIDFAANGGTNFSKVELLRSSPVEQKVYEKLAMVGHSAEEMVGLANQLIDELGPTVQCKQIIISGGVRDFLDGYYLINKLAMPSVYGQAAAFLRHAQGSYEALRTHVLAQLRGLELAQAFLRIR